jgi:F-type H+-transporting ATPase subunit b
LKLKADNEKLLDEARVERDAMLKKAQQTAEIIVEEAKKKLLLKAVRL